MGVAGGGRIVTMDIVMVTVGDTVTVRVRAIVRGIELEIATRTDKTCTTTSVISPDLQHRARREIRRDHLQVARGRTMSTPTRVAMFIAEMIRADGNRDHKIAGTGVTGCKAVSNAAVVQGVSRAKDRVQAVPPTRSS